jgi:hypothetical protein
VGSIVIIDNNPIRRAALRNTLEGIDRGRAIKDYASIKDEVESGELESDSVILLHVGKAQNEDIMQALKERYLEFIVICYSGGLEVATEYKIHESQNKRHCWYNQVVGEKISGNIKRNFQDFFKSLKQGNQENLCQQLHSVDLIREAKLEILSLIAERKSLQDIQDTQSYNRLNGEGLVNREDVEGALSNGLKLRDLRNRWFPE